MERSDRLPAENLQLGGEAPLQTDKTGARPDGCQVQTRDGRLGANQRPPTGLYDRAEDQEQ
jgi:hypothetical protein